MCAAIECLRFLVEIWNVAQKCNSKDERQVLKSGQSQVFRAFNILFISIQENLKVKFKVSIIFSTQNGHLSLNL